MATFLLLIFACNFSTYATIRTVSNNPATLGEFTTIQSAIDASADGDTIYVHGSPNTYGSFTILDKYVTVIGPGWAPNKHLPLTARIAGCELRNSPSAGSPSGTELNGLIFTTTVTPVYNAGGDFSFGNIRIVRCQFDQAVNFNLSASDVLFEGCLFSHNLSFNGAATYENFLFQNNLFYSNSCCTNNSIAGLVNSVNVRFDHNLFYQFSSGNVDVFGSNCRFLTLTNNIFNERNAASALSFSTFNNNITYNAGTAAGDEPWTVNGNVDGGGNVSNQNPEMADQVSVDAGSYSGLYDFTIASGPANNAGADGKDIGLLYDTSGSLNWSNSRNSRIPRIYSMNIINPTIAEGGTLNVSVEARKSN